MERFKALNQKELKSLFDKADVDKSGHVSVAELKQLMYPDGNADDAQVVFTFAQMDKNSDGKVKVSEFVGFVVFSKMDKKPKEADEKAIMNAFQAKDKDGDSMLSLDEICSGLGCETDEEKQMAESLFKRLDADANAQVSLHEFAALYGTELAPSQPVASESADKQSTVEEVVEHFDVETAESIKEVFRNADTNGDGCISEQELRDLFRELDDWSDEEFETLFKEVDKNGDGKIQHQEFIDWVCGGGAKKAGIEQEDLADAGEAVKEKESFDLAV
eukprot:gnl/MRDRNA2_/MRDRNA2_98550_c0_seq1.p1 gnl/MRDRNA2_/MRDRNA2_98550_c0~~gnl/MRDRNA2_/MRDRNA2_98550_c0_seq1.p1  ORF type:complete len:275 (-),score=94.25 gnl/MRDRNA2_/MRDRNA2_98550_c0_seq1:23-847(-)